MAKKLGSHNGSLKIKLGSPPNLKIREGIDGVVAFKKKEEFMKLIDLSNLFNAKIY